MKKLLTLSLLILTLIISLAACGDKSPDHTHEFSDWVTAKEPTVTEEGLSVRVCECGFSETKPLAKITASEGLAFVSNNDGTCYLSGIGSCTTKSIFVPSTSPSGDTVTEIGMLAFKDCTNITSVTLPDSITAVKGSAFAGCTSLKSITFGKGLTSIGTVAFIDCKSLEAVNLPDGTKAIGDFAFSGCESITSVRLPDTLEEIGDNVFFTCEKLKLNTYDNALYLGNESNPCVLLMKAKDRAIESCNINEKTKFIYDRAFYMCDSLTAITIPEGILGLCDGAFSYCDALTSIEIPASVTNVAPAAIYFCAKLEGINVHADNAAYKSIDGTVYTKDGKTLILYAAGNRAKSFAVPDTVTEIAEEAFYGARHLESVTFTDTLEVIGDGAFSLCDVLDGVVIPSSVTEIGSSAFSFCTSLTSLTIGISVKTIGSYAFSNCERLADVYYAGSAEEWSEIEIERENECLTNADIHYDQSYA